MKLINKIIQKHKTNSKALYYSKCVIDNYKSLGIKIDKFKEIMSTLSQTRRKNQSNERKDLVDQLNKILTYINNSLDNFIFDYVDLSKFVKTNNEFKFNKKTADQIEFALRTKNMLRKEFETLYLNFKSMAKKFDDVPMCKVLKKINNILLFEKGERKQKRFNIIVCYPNW